MKTTLLIAITLLAAGCATKSLELPGGVKYTSQTFLTSSTASKIELKKTGAETYDFSIGGMTAEQQKALQATMAQAADLLKTVP